MRERRLDPLQRAADLDLGRRLPGRLAPVHLGQLITYVRLAGKPAGLLINFNEKRLVDGVRRVLNDRPAWKPQQATAVRRDREQR